MTSNLEQFEYTYVYTGTFSLTRDTSPLFEELEHKSVFTECTDKNIVRMDSTLLWGSLALTQLYALYMFNQLSIFQVFLSILGIIAGEFCSCSLLLFKFSLKISSTALNSSSLCHYCAQA